MRKEGKLLCLESYVLVGPNQVVVRDPSQELIEEKKQFRYLLAV
jgi:hypothetical protein